MQTILTMATDGEQAAFPGKKPADLAFTKARVHLKEQAPETGVSWHEILQKANVNAASGSGKADEKAVDTVAAWLVHGTHDPAEVVSKILLTDPHGIVASAVVRSNLGGE